MNQKEVIRDQHNWDIAKEIDNADHITLTQWEVDFLESVMQQMRSGVYLSKTQSNRLKQIYEEYGL